MHLDSNDFTIDALLEEARTTTGLDDFGPGDFLTGLEMTARAYAENPLHERRRARRRRRMIDLLATRLRCEDAFATHSEIRDRAIERPLVLTGMPRSGTSALFNLIAAHPASRPLLMWETQFPDPCPGLEPGAPDPRRQAIVDHIEQGRWSSAEMKKIHFVTADSPEECPLLQSLAFGGVQLGVEIFLEPYASWFLEEDLRSVYAYQADLMRLLDWQRRPGDRWTLKSPAHMWGIDALVATFPDVRIVWSHRDPAACVASVCSMTHAMIKTMLPVDPKELGPRVFDFYATSLERGLAARERHDAARFVDVSHDELVADPLGVVRRIHSHFDLELDREATHAIETVADAQPKDRHGKHEYDFEAFGLDEARVRERFAPYVERFRVEAMGS